MAHLTSFTVENFKRFEHFEMNNIGQFNLIVGDNNVGKTSVLEALLIDEEPEIFRLRLLKVLTEFRGFNQLREPYWFSFIPRKSLIHGFQPTRFWGVNQGTISIEPFTNPFSLENWSWQTSVIAKSFSLSNNTEIRYNGALQYDGTNLFHVPLVPFAQGYFHGLTDIYSAYFQRSQERKNSLIEGLRVVIPDINGVDIDTASAAVPTIFISQLKAPTTIPLALFGDGALKLFRILIEIRLHENQRLMIDEIDAGIHVGHLQKFWQVILLAAIAAKVQLFATTHNWECLQVFKEVLEEPEMQKYQVLTRCFTLVDSPVTKRVEAICSTFPQFEAAVQNGTELRGGTFV